MGLVVAVDGRSPLPAFTDDTDDAEAGSFFREAFDSRGDPEIPLAKGVVAVALVLALGALGAGEVLGEGTDDPTRAAMGCADEPGGGGRSKDSHYLEVVLLALPNALWLCRLLAGFGGGGGRGASTAIPAL